MTLVGKKVHMVGIGGVSMSPLAEVLHKRGCTVTGSDGQESPTVDYLRTLGIAVEIGHHSSHLGTPDFVIRTAAAKEDNPEIQEARARNIPVYERAEGWGAIMREYENAICISGTHGKTTTTAMTAEIFLHSQRDPSFMLGGVLPSVGFGHRMGEGDTIIVESCEYCNSFHYFFPTIAVILNIEEDHLDFFRDLEEIIASFRHFAEKVPSQGHILLCNEDETALKVVQSLPHLTFGVESGDIHCQNLQWEKGYPSFDVVYQGKVQGSVRLQVPGRHNVLNALAAIGSALLVQVPMKDISEGLAQFTGAGRRFQHKGVYHEAVVMDDYAHHPTELSALYHAVTKLEYKRVICAFQPHTFTRTKAFFHEFAEILAKFDQVIVVDIFPAREVDTGEVSSLMLAKAIPSAQYGGSLEESLQLLQPMVQEGDLILTVGAGDIFRLGEALVALKD